jgi:hypothetical protein
MLEVSLEQQIQAAAAAVRLVLIQQTLEAQAAQVSSLLNTQTVKQSQTPEVGLHIQLQQRVDLALQHLLPEPAMFLGVNAWHITHF